MTAAAVPESLDVDLRQAEACARAAGVPLEKVYAERTRLLTIADDCAAEAVAVDGKREGLLLKAFRNDDQAAGLLAQIEPHARALRQRERDARDAAAPLQPQIDALAGEAQRAARAVVELRHQRLVTAHERQAAALRAALAQIWPAVAAYIEAGEAAARSHRDTFGEPVPSYRHEPPAFKAARFVNVEAHKFFGVGQYRALELNFPLDAGTL
jgi:hypothetical protein